MTNFHIIFSYPVSYSAQEIWRMFRFQVNYIGVKGNGIFLQTNSNKKKWHMWRFFSNSEIKHVITFGRNRLPNGMTSEAGEFNGTRLTSNMTPKIRVTYDDDPDVDYESALADFNEQHPFEDCDF